MSYRHLNDVRKSTGIDKPFISFFFIYQYGVYFTENHIYRLQYLRKGRLKTIIYMKNNIRTKKQRTEIKIHPVEKK